MAPGQDLSLASPHQSRSLRCDTSVEQKRIEDFQANRRTLRPPRYTGPPPAAATATRALLPALHDSDAHRSSFAAHLRAAIDAKTSRRGMPRSRPSGGTDAVGLELGPLRSSSAVDSPAQRPAQSGLPATTIACLKEERHDHIQVATAR
jgi:hypothetical protein